MTEQDKIIQDLRKELKEKEETIDSMAALIETVRYEADEETRALKAENVKLKEENDRLFNKLLKLELSLGV